MYAETDELRPGTFTYDINIMSEDGDAIVQTTLVYQAKFIVLPKKANIYNAY
jgi:hypothetical protein